jgi:hypothetical protein
MTDTKLVELYGLGTEEGECPKQSPSGIRTRRSELVEEGIVKDSGRLETLPSNRKAIVWELT